MLMANVSWGLMSPLSKLLMIGGFVTPLLLSTMRMAGAMLLFWMISFFLPQEHVNHKDLARLFGASMLGIVLNQGCFIFGVGLSSPADASIITTSMPLWAMVLAAFFLKEPITGKKVLGIAFGACGALLLILGGTQANNVKSGDSNISYILGDMLVLLAQLSYALYIVLYKNFVNMYSLVTLMKWMFTYAFVCMLPFCYSDMAVASWQSFTPTAWGSIAFIVVVGTFLSYMFVVIGQKTLRPTVAGMYNYIQPIVACIVAISLGMDSFNMAKGMAVILIFGGVYLVTISRSRTELDAYHAKNSAPEGDS